MRGERKGAVGVDRFRGRGSKAGEYIENLMSNRIGCNAVGVNCT